MGQQLGTEQFRERLHIIVQYPPLALFCASRKIGLNHLFHCSIACRVSRICPQKPRRKFLETVDSFNPTSSPIACPDEHLATAQSTSFDRYRWRITDQRSLLTTRRLERRFAPPPEKSKSATTGTTTPIDIERPNGIGNLACAAVLEYRHHDKSNRNGANRFILPAF
jgi:hypothetical protein